MLPSFAYEHKVFVGPFSRRFRKAQVQNRVSQVLNSTPELTLAWNGMAWHQHVPACRLSWCVSIAAGVCVPGVFKSPVRHADLRGARAVVLPAAAAVGTLRHRE